MNELTDLTERMAIHIDRQEDMPTPDKESPNEDHPGADTRPEWDDGYGIPTFQASNLEKARKDPDGFQKFSGSSSYSTKTFRDVLSNYDNRFFLKFCKIGRADRWGASLLNS